MYDYIHPSSTFHLVSWTICQEQVFIFSQLPFLKVIGNDLSPTHWCKVCRINKSTYSNSTATLRIFFLRVGGDLCSEFALMFFNQFCRSSSKEKSETGGMKKARRMPCRAICWKHWDGRNISLSILFSSYTVNIRRLDGDRFHSGGNSGEFQFRCNMHFNSVQICFWLQFDSRRLIHMNSNEIPWDALCIQEEDTPCHSYAHNSVSYTDGGYLLSMCMLIAARVSVQTIRMFSHRCKIRGWEERCSKTRKTQMFLWPGTHSATSYSRSYHFRV